MEGESEDSLWDFNQVRKTMWALRKGETNRGQVEWNNTLQAYEEL